MSIFISGSIAYDTVLHFDGMFAEQFRGDLRHLNLTLQAHSMVKQFGGCAGNIAYSLKCLGGDPVIVTTVGMDADEYLEHLRKLGITTDGILKINDAYTAQAIITTDALGNQLCTFHEGAMAFAASAPWPDRHYDWGIVTPTATPVMKTHVEKLFEKGIPIIWDMGQASAYLTGQDIEWFLNRIDMLTVSEFEWQVLLEKTARSANSLYKKVPCIVITAGSEGVKTIKQGEEQCFEAVTVQNPVNPVGCGDAFRGGLLRGLELGLSWEQTIQLAMLMGAIKVTHESAQGYHLAKNEAARLYKRAFKESIVL